MDNEKFEEFERVMGACVLVQAFDNSGISSDTAETVCMAFIGAKMTERGASRVTLTCPAGELVVTLNRKQVH